MTGKSPCRLWNMSNVNIYKQPKTLNSYEPTPLHAGKTQGKFKGVTTDTDKRHSDPEYGGLSSGEKAAISRGQMPKGVQEDKEKKEAAMKYAHDKGVKFKE